MPYVIQSSFSKGSRFLSVVYATLCLLLSLVMGAALQSLTLAESSAIYFGKNPMVFSLVFATLIIPLLVLKNDRIDSVTAVVIPIATLVYCLVCFVVIFKNITKLPEIISDIFKNAFTPLAAVGGGGGALFIAAMREGFARGLLSNEAGAGTSSFAEARGEHRHPCATGLLGMAEVFFDTVLLCTLTGLAVLTSGVSLSASGGMSIVISAVATAFSSFSAPIILFLVFAFVYSTVVCWYYYASECLAFLFSSRGKNLFTAFFIASVVLGAIFPYYVLIYITDTLLLLMSAITLLTLIKNTERIVTLSVDYGLLKKSDKALVDDAACLKREE